CGKLSVYDSYCYGLTYSLVYRNYLPTKLPTPPCVQTTPSPVFNSPADMGITLHPVRKPLYPQSAIQLSTALNGTCLPVYKMDSSLNSLLKRNLSTVNGSPNNSSNRIL